MICSFCAEKIKNIAIICRHCGRDVPKKSETEIGADMSQGLIPSNTAKPTSKKRQLQAFAVIVVLLGAIGIFFSRNLKVKTLLLVNLKYLNI